MQYFYKKEAAVEKEKMAKYKRDNFPLRVITTNMEDIISMHNHDFFELVFFAKGNASHTLISGDKKLSYSVMQGDCFAIMPQEYHSFENGNLACYYNIIFSPSLISAEQKELKKLAAWNKIFGDSCYEERNKVHLDLQERIKIDDYIGRLIEELKGRQEGYKVAARAILLEILLLVLRCSPKKMPFANAVPTKSSPYILSIINDMEKAPEKHYTLNELAKKSNMCVSGFTKKFRSLVGVSPVEYLLNLRVEKAEQMLISSSLPIYTIANNCGFYDINYFIKVFRRFRGNTPAKFRKIKKLEKESAEQ